jgi:glycosyltransferase involved in cell wall biosynthesis
MIDASEMLLTVLIPVYNGEKYLDSAINSILNQTFTRFEFLIINDGSTDHSEEIIRSYTDPRINYVKNDGNKGIVATLNIGLEMSRGKYIARMDADDIAFPDRLEKQLNFMLSNPECKLCGTNAIAINEIGQQAYKLKRSYLMDDIKVQHLFRNSFIHPSVMLDAAVAKKFKYSSNHQYAEDYYLFSQITLNYKVANLKDNLLNYRIHPENITSKKQDEMNKSEMKTMNFLLSNLFDEQVSDQTVFIHHSFLTRNFEKIDLHIIEAHLLKIKCANKIKQAYDSELLAVMLQKEWFNFLFFSKEKSVLRKFIKSKLFSFKRFNFRQIIKLTIKK